MAHATVTSKAQIDKLGDRLKRGDRDRHLLVDLAQHRNRFIESTEDVAEAITQAIKRRFKFDITQRPAKSTASIIAKLKRENVRLSQIQDIGGIRVVVSKTSVQDRAVRVIRRLYPRCKVVDRRLNPQHGYRAVHVIVANQECLIEVQVRTSLQNNWAQYSEKLADVVDNDIKYGGGPPQLRASLKYSSDAVGRIEALESQADQQKKTGMNEIFRKNREGLLTPPERARLKDYQALRARIRAIRPAWLSYLGKAAKS